ncbi:MAG: hypothetical protein D6677_06070 [Calditrichaeota bacterium]|nr:MAG: hypothetical protein D6677_06070 [Calditrichota bacterium]
MSYLYGSSIQGIQGFIFETNELKEIVGASEIVESLTYDIFIENFGIDEHHFIQHAAGNIKLVHDDRETIARIVKTWPKIVEENAPGLTLSQAVVSFTGDLTKEVIDELEEKLKIARNTPVVTQPLSYMGIIRSRKTGKAAVEWDKDNMPVDSASIVKRKLGHENAAQKLIGKCFAENETVGAARYPFNITDMLGDGKESGWLAVIHADGNGLGRMILKMAERLQQNHHNVQKAFKDFSTSLERATVLSVQEAVKGVMESIKEEENKRLPFRPVIIGGDDMTIIIRADLALTFTENYLRAFQKHTKNEMKTLVNEFRLTEFKEGLTACAGIAYMKSSYPFHYAVHLADGLCGDAKKASKKINADNIPASLAFHKIQDSFIEDYNQIVERELTPHDGLSFKYGPYFLDKIDDKPTVSDLRNKVKLLLEDDAPRSGLRNWLALVHDDPARAQQWMERIKEVTTDTYIKGLELDQNRTGKTHLYDVMTIASIAKL